MINEENNKVYETMNCNGAYLTAFLLVDNYVEYGMFLYDYKYILTELAYENNLGLSASTIYRYADMDKMVADEDITELIYYFIDYLKEEDLFDEFVSYLDEEQREEIIDNEDYLQLLIM